MAYESDSFREHHLVRLPVLRQLVELGWDRAQIICPSPDSDDTEWRVPKTPSDATKRERGASFAGYPVDIAVFSTPGGKGNPDELLFIVECKAPEEEAGISQLTSYLGFEPTVRLGVWTNGSDAARVYRLPGSLHFRTQKGAGLPKPGENLLLADSSKLTYGDLEVPTEGALKAAFRRLLDVIASRDSTSTRREEQLGQVANVLLLKLESDQAAEWDQARAVSFQLADDPAQTHRALDAQFACYIDNHPALFPEREDRRISLDDDTVQEAVALVQRLNIAKVGPSAMSLAFQTFRNAALKLGDGQYFTPLRVIEVGVELMQITHADTVIDPACGTGGFLSEAMASVARTAPDTEALRRWAHSSLFGVDRDSVSVKLARALMVGIGDGSTNICHGDSLRESKWQGNEGRMRSVLGEGRYSVVLTNPPFGKGLVISADDAKRSNLELCKHTANGHPSNSFAKTTELGIAFVERAWKLLRPGGRLGIILPETYFFSKSYAWFREWLDAHFTLRGVLGVPMEAFQGFCRAKTNFYVFEKTGCVADGATRPCWFRDGYVWVSNAPTIGLNKDGDDLFIVDDDGTRTGVLDNRAAVDVHALIAGNTTSTCGYVASQPLAGSYVGVPGFAVDAATESFRQQVAHVLEGFTAVPLGHLIDGGLVDVRAGHGSPSADMRTGDVPYIKVSDLRDGRVNPNSTNMVSERVAKKFWGGAHSGLAAWDVCTPARASKNIGEPCMLMPGQERAVFTKEILVFRVSADAPFDAFYLFWALQLPSVRAQWQHVVFMQTNREDLGDRYRYIEVPFACDAMQMHAVSEPHRRYFTEMARLREELEATALEL